MLKKLLHPIIRDVELTPEVMKAAQEWREASDGQTRKTTGDHLATVIAVTLQQRLSEEIRGIVDSIFESYPPHPHIAAAAASVLSMHAAHVMVASFPGAEKSLTPEELTSFCVDFSQAATLGCAKRARRVLAGKETAL